MTSRIGCLVAAIASAFAVTAYAQDVGQGGAPSPVSMTSSSSCELHIFPTKNYLAINTGVLVGLGPIGVVADIEGHKNRVKTVKELMAEILTPEAQIEQLNKVGILSTLKLPADTAIIVEPPFPSAEDYKRDPLIKEKMKSVLADEKAGKRFTASASRCYSELVTAYIFYQKAAMYGTRLFTMWKFRDFQGKSTVVRTAKGQVENSASGFPPQSSDGLETSRQALLGAFAKDFTKWQDLKNRS